MNSQISRSLSSNRPERECFFTFNYKDGYIHTCQNRLTGLEEVKYSVENHHAKANTVIGAKRNITNYLRSNPLKWVIKRNSAPSINLNLYRSRAITCNEKTTLDYIVTTMLHTLEIPISTNEISVCPKQFANNITNIYDDDTPRIAECSTLLQSL